MAVPPEWWAESEEDSILVGDHDDVGCIEISTLHKESGEFATDSIETIARDEAEQSLQWSTVRLGDFCGRKCRLSGGGRGNSRVVCGQRCLAAIYYL